MNELTLYYLQYGNVITAIDREQCVVVNDLHTKYLSKQFKEPAAKTQH